MVELKTVFMFKLFPMLRAGFGILMLYGCMTANTSSVINNLKCENLHNPLGIATSSPRFSWNLNLHGNGTSQKAFQILVASNINLLTENSADLWNSGRILSHECILVPYRGTDLTSGKLCYWKVRVWDEDDKASKWSDPASFSIGLIEKNDWKGEYIGFQGDSEECESPLLRKTFTVSELSDRVFIHVNSLGYHEIWLNGQKAGENVLVPAVSQFNKRSLSVTYDITSMIRKGKNDLIIWIGQGWYGSGLPGVVNKGPVVRAQVERLNSGQWETFLYTDSAWTGRMSGYSTIGTWRPGKFGGEKVDGSKLFPDLSSSSLDRATWSKVRIADIPDHNATPQMTESNIIARSFKPDTIYSVGDRTWLIDMGTTLTGWFEIHFPRLDKQQEVVLEYCDHLDKEGRTVNQGQTDRYIASGNDGEFFINKFNYHGYRYVKISNLDAEPLKNAITGYLIHTGYDLASTFKCSDDDMNKIHDMIAYTLRCLSLGGYLVDCPQIERLGYGGDGNASTETAQTMFDLNPLYTNWLQAWADCIRDDGGMPHTAPNPYPAGGGPYWCGFIITATWRTYMNYGDIRLLEKYYPAMQKWLGYAEKYSVSDLLKPWPDTEYRSWYLGDWATPEGVDQTNKASIDLVNNCFMTVCYETISRIAGILGRTEDQEKYRIKKVSIIERINSELLDADRYVYGSGSQIDLAYPLLAGAVPDSLQKKVRENLYNVIEVNNKGHVGCGLVGIPVFTEWAVNNHEANLFYSILKKKEYPGYLYMTENGASTTWEHWNGARSRIHNCYNGIGSWFYQAIGGIQKDENFPGYRKVLIDPQFPDGIEWAKVSKQTPYGPLGVSWNKESGSLRLELSIPAGCSAVIMIPDGVENYSINRKNHKRGTQLPELGNGFYIIEYKIIK